LVQKHPDSAFAHFSMAYVLRYAGRLDEAQRECEKTWSLDSGNYTWRTCSLAFAEAGKAARAMDFLGLDTNSEWTIATRVAVFMREGKTAEAQQAAQQMTANPNWMRGLVQACLNKGPSADIDKMAQQAAKDLLPQHDPELKYLQGSMLAACGAKQTAFKFLHQAVDGNYCAYEALQLDPLLAGIRDDAEFHRIVQAAGECQQKFAAAQGMTK
jgi:hypothetical protein